MAEVIRTPTAQLPFKTSTQTKAEVVTTILEANEISDLKRFLNRRQCLYECNGCLVYIFHTVQASGILVTTLAVGYDLKYLVWIGVGLNVMASLIHAFEKTNSEWSKRLLKEIDSIRLGNYIDESDLNLETEKETFTKENCLHK